MSPSYLPSRWQRLKEIFNSIIHTKNPPDGYWKDTDVLVICDVIDAYRTLFDDTHIAALNLLIKSARENNVVIIFTRWSRFNNVLHDAIDIKGHWSDYIPENECGLILDSSGAHIVDVYHTNAFASDKFQQLTLGKERLILAGCWTESCVLHTARAATEKKNMSPSIIVKSATSGHFPQSWLALNTMQLLYGNVVNHMTKQCKHEKNH
jgi:nicotinamidase-related amidase